MNRTARLVGATAVALAAAVSPAPALPPQLAAPEVAALAASLHDRILAARRAGDLATARAALDEMEQSAPEIYAAGSYDYLAGLVASEAGDEEAAVRAWQRLVKRQAALSDRAAVALATVLGREHPAQALPLVAGFSQRYRPSAVASEARLLEVVMRARNGDWLGAERMAASLPRGERRDARLGLFALAGERGRRGDARSRARSLLRERSGDAAAVDAARYLVAHGSEALERSERMTLGRVLYSHRDFAAARVELARVAAESPTASERGEALFLLGRSAQKAGDDGAARAAFERLAAVPGWREKGTYHLGRVALGCGEDALAVARFEEVAILAPRTPLAAEALAKLVRIHGGRRELDLARASAARLVAEFGRGSRWVCAAATEVAGAALAAGDAERALVDLEMSRPESNDCRRELAYWRGAALAALGRDREAMAELGRAIAGFDLLSILARERMARLPGDLRRETVSGLLVRAGRAQAAGDLAATATIAFEALDGGASGDDERAAVALLQSAYRQLPGTRVLFDLALPVTSGIPSRPLSARAPPALRAELLRHLGLEREAAADLRLGGVPLADANRTFAVAELARQGGDIRLALLYGQRLARGLPKGFHPACLPPQVLRLIYPDAYGERLEAEARVRGVDPDLVRAVMREESRFDPAALSPAGARGLMQFIPETARRVGAAIGLPAVADAAVHDPQVAIPLGAAYLAELIRAFDGNQGAAVAAYNAGEEAAFDWLGRSATRLLDELYREIEYSETRAYVDRVLTTLAGYKVRRWLEDSP